MLARRLFILSLLALCVLAEPRRSRNRERETVAKDAKNEQRRGKLFSLFNIVQFQNAQCISQMTSSAVTQPNSKNPAPSTNREGICYSAQECSDAGGTASGSCAAGFGVCCIIVLSASSTVTRNCTYLQNPEFPSGYAGTSAVAYTVQKCSNNVCSLRLDFETFCTLGPANTQENPNTCQDPFTITSMAGTTFPTLCGKNSGQHVYVDIGGNTGDTATLSFAFPGVANTARMWDVKVTQVECGINNPPTGCFQYYTATTGTIQTFNFNDGTQTHLGNQQYTSCIRQAAGFCCVQYTPCPGVPDAFSLNEVSNVNTQGLVDSQCTNDYIQISGASATCTSKNVGVPLTSRLCGTLFTTVNQVVKGAAAQSIPICDCSAPFDIGFRTDNAIDVAGQSSLSRGVCLCYTQLPC